MPRANRFLLPGYVWHITHRCHQRQFLLKFERDRRRWLHWLFEARKRFGLSVLNYIVTSNHVHLLVLDRGRGEIAKSMQLVAGRTAQEYNRRKSRNGAFWEDRYHATAVDTESYLARCIAYIDLNMVRAGAVDHPEQWRASGYYEIHHTPERYRLTDLPVLMNLLGVPELSALQRLRREWAEEGIQSEHKAQPAWSESIAIGGRDFVERVKAELGGRGRWREIEKMAQGHVLREESAGYTAIFRNKMAVLRGENRVFFEENG